MCVVPLGWFMGFQCTTALSIRVRPVETSYFGKISLTWLKQNLHRKGKTYACQDCQHPEAILTEQACSIKGQSGRSRASMIGPSCTRTGSQSEHRIRFISHRHPPPPRPHLPLPRKANLNSNLDSWGILPMMAYMGRFRPKGVSFSGFRYMKGQGFHQLKYKRVGKSLIWVFKQAHRTNK